MSYVVWLVAVAGGVVLAFCLRWWLTWRLFVFVPLFGEIALLVGFAGNGGIATTLHLLIEPNTWLLFAYFFVYGMVFEGPFALILCGIGWLFIVRRLVGIKISHISFLFLGTLSGAIVGGFFEIALWILDQQSLTNFFALREWTIASAAGGAAGGFIVAYYATKQASPLPDKC